MPMEGPEQRCAKSAAPTGDQAATSVVQVRAAVVKKLNLADFQNSVPALHELVVVNETAQELRDLTLSVSSEPAFVRPRNWTLDAVGPGQTFHVTQLDLELDGTHLSRLTEAEPATVVFELQSAQRPGELIARCEQRIELLARNQWGGITYMPEMVAAFVQPNDPAVDRVLKAAALALEAAGKSGSIDGYTHGAKRAWELTSGIWAAVLQHKLNYALPPASFEHAGQKVRSPSQVLDAGLATCLDLALMFAACLEQAHLNPLLIVTREHVFVGVWLRNEEFTSAVIDDVTALRKRLKLQELLVFETTLVAQGKPVSFSQALANAAKQLSEEEDDKFELVVDVKRARMSRIRPLALSEAVAIAAQPEVEPAIAVTVEEPPDLPEDNTDDVPTAELDPKDRLARWQRKLLDLSLRNALLNFKGGKKALLLEAAAPALEDALAEGQTLKLLPSADLMEGRDLRSQQLHEARTLEDLRRQHAAEALQRREIYIRLQQEELENRLVELYRGARSAMQEGGANTLYVSLGFLIWSRPDKPEVRIKAPLVLMPVTLNRRSARSGFTLEAHEDEPLFNPTLLEMLRQDFQLELGVTAGDLPRDENGLDIVGIWKRVRASIKDVRGWEVSEDVVLSMLSFAKYLMWKDLTARTEELRKSPVVAHLIDTPREPYASTVSFPETRRLDTDYPPQQVFSPLPADSSQLSAVLAAAKGKDFVLIGPPGTGKSQTIANLIAQCLAEDKRVLFVAEKIAALDVVYRRLREVGLGEYCLELHSNKSRKLDVLSQLQKSWDSKGEVDAAGWSAKAQQLQRVREQLSTYVERLHRRHGNGLTVYQAIGSAVGGDAIPLLCFTWPSARAHDEAALAALREIAGRLQVNATAVGPENLRTGPLTPVHATEWSAKWQHELQRIALHLQSASLAFNDAATELARCLGIGWPALHRQQRLAIGSLARALPGAAGQDWSFCARADSDKILADLNSAQDLLDQHRKISANLPSPWPLELQAQLKRAVELLERRRATQAELGAPWPASLVDEMEQGVRLVEEMTRLRSSLSVKYGSGVAQLNVAQLQREFAKAEKAFWPLSWLGKRKVRSALEATIEGAGEPRIAQDLAALVRIRNLRDEVQQINPGAASEGLWAGVKTRIDHVKAALKANAALQAARLKQSFALDGLAPAAEGLCGERWHLETQRLRELVGLDLALFECEGLAEPSLGLWRGHDTDVAVLRAAMAFEQERQGLAQGGSMSARHIDVAEGHCGAELQRRHAQLQARAAFEVQLRSFDRLVELCPGTWRGLATDIDAIMRVSRFHASLQAGLAGLGLDPVQLADARRELQDLLSARRSELVEHGPAHRACQTFLQRLTELHESVDHFATTAAQPESVRRSFADYVPEELAQAAAEVAAHHQALNAWCAWRRAQAHARDAGLAALVGAIEVGDVAPVAANKAFEVNYARWWLGEAVDEDDVLKRFVSAEHERRIQEFRALDDEFIGVTRQWIRAKLCASLPAQDAVLRSSEWGVLRREIIKKRMHLPLRLLLQEIPSVVLRLTPCLLMSPLSIAQYLSADTANFDLVVFDEASQIPVWDAIGAMARGKQVVMVGDPKQLPPTNFFSRSDSDDDDDVSEGDLESILDECLAASLPTRNLSWHYRSRHESLIAFSNHRYYAGALVTFPSPETEDRAVSFHHVNGRYEKGGARINKPEAQALVADLVGRLRSPGFRQSGLTIGVVTFNSEQQCLIEDLLDDERRKDPELEHYFAEVQLEPVFVKNLESVQGDERDIMYFSITYGPDVSGAVSMNFGPLNRDGGERRLNVAVTRARHELRVFSSLRGEQMDLSRTKAPGVRDLKHFLEFAERGRRSLAEAHHGSLGDFESPFEVSVAEALARKSWQVHTQIGASSFRVDLGVVHPDFAGRYLAGVECDGATYHRSATARDRDKLREQILRGLGWEIVRVWSTDWWMNPGGTLERVHHRLVELLEADRAKRPPVPGSDDTAVASDDPTGGSVDPARADAEASAAIASAALGSIARGEAPTGPLNTGLELAYALASDVLEPVSEDKAGHVGSDVFRATEPAEAVPSGAVDADRFFESGYNTVLQPMVEWVVEREGPILDAALARRIARAHGFQRTGSRIQERVEALARSRFLLTEEAGGTFYWPDGLPPSSNVAFRRPANEASSRGVEEVCEAELTSLAKAVLSRGYGGHDALISMARELGLQRLREASRGRLEEALRRALTSGTNRP